MKEPRMKFNLSLWLALTITALLGLSGCLFKRSIAYGLKNRSLILQNDSLLSVTIELNRQLHQYQADSLSRSKRSTARSK